MRDPALTLTTAQVAERFNRSLKWFYKRRRRLEAEGFPSPLPGTSNRLWSAEAVDDWISGAAAPAAGPAPQSETARIAQERSDAMLREAGPS